MTNALEDRFAHLFAVEQRVRALETAQVRLQDHGSGNTSAVGPSSEANVEGEHLDRELVDAKLEASEARTDTKFAEMRGDLAAFRGEVTTALADLRTGMAEDRAAMLAEFAAVRSDVALSRSDVEGRISTLDTAVAAKAAPRDIWLAALAVFGAVLAVLAFGSDRLSLGIGLADQRQEQLARDNSQDEAVKNIGASLQSIDRKVSGR